MADEDAISRSDAIRIASGYCHWTNIPDELAKLPSVTPKQCEDAISRQAVEAITWEEPSYTDALNALTEVREKIRTLPSVSTEKVGCWVEIDDEPHEVWECDHCGFVIDGSGCVDPYEYRDIYKYCPNCGAKMQEEIETCKDCTNKCIMYDPNMKGCKEVEPQESEV